MIGTLLNGAGILVGGLLGLTLRRPWSGEVQLALKGLLGVATVYVGLRAVWLGLGGGFVAVLKQIVILVAALTLGRLLGRLLRIQAAMNHAGQFAKAKMAQASPSAPTAFADGFLTCTVLFCVAPLALIGSVQDGLGGHWQALGIKTVMDGLATMAFVRSFGWSAMLSAVPVVSLQGTLTLLARLCAPWLGDQGLVEAIHVVGGMLVFTVSLIILDLKKVEVGDYLPSLVVAPVLTWLWR